MNCSKKIQIFKQKGKLGEVTCRAAVYIVLVCYRMTYIICITTRHHDLVAHAHLQ